MSLRREVARLRAEAQASQAERTALASRVETREAQLAKLRATRAVLSKSLFGRKSERQSKPGAGAASSAAPRHADETTWRVQALLRRGRVSASISYP